VTLLDAGIVVAGAVAAVLAGVMAYLITRSEMNKHFRDARTPHRAAAKDAAVTAGFFLALALLLAIVLPRMLRAQ
jgi:hypothetical protein